jgi:hypothetical protein
MALDDRMNKFTLTSPFLDITYKDIPKWQVIILSVLWFASWIGISVGLLWLYAVWFAGVVGFQTALLVGVGLIFLGVGQSE